MSAVISNCGLYRYALQRRWGEGPTCVFIMLNPSTADAEKDDPTIRRCLGFAKREGCGKLRVANLFAFRATHPADMRVAADPVGPLNDQFLSAVMRDADGVCIAAWGAHGEFMGRGEAVAGRFRGRLLCLGKTAGGHPKHPLRLAKDTPLVNL